MNGEPNLKPKRQVPLSPAISFLNDKNSTRLSIRNFAALFFNAVFL
jgi:hypothetical protein